MPRSGTLVIACQNLDFSGANQVVLNIVTGTMHEGNVVILAPKLGPFASRFVEVGAAVRTGNLLDLLKEIRDVFCIVCNTIMTAPYVRILTIFTFKSLPNFYLFISRSLSLTDGSFHPLNSCTSR